MRCKVTISGSREADEVKTEGEYTFFGGGFTLDYTIAGDNCRMELAGKTITQSRRGNVNTDITFASGKNTVCMLLSGELTGSVPVKTQSLHAEATKSGATVNIEYFLGGAFINLRLTVSPEDIQ